MGIVAILLSFHLNKGLSNFSVLVYVVAFADILVCMLSLLPIV